MQRHGDHKIVVFNRKLVRIKVAQLDLYMMPSFYEVFSFFVEAIETHLPLRIEHFQQNGNIKNITHIDSSNNELSSGVDPQKNNAKACDNFDHNEGQMNDLNVESNVDPHKEQPQEEEKDEGYSLIRFPTKKGCLRQIMWIVIWPIHFLFFFTIPDCERPRLKKLFPLTFLMCIVWIGSLSYMVAWMITIIGN